MSNAKLTDAIGLIQRAEASMASDKDNQPYVQLLGDLVSNFKEQLSMDHGLPIEFFDPVDPDVDEVLVSEAPVESVDPELSPKAHKLYETIEMSIGSKVSYAHFFSPGFPGFFNLANN